MTLFDRLDVRLDYNNTYSLNSALNTLNTEFSRAVKAGSRPYAKEVLTATQQLYTKFTTMFRESADYGETMGAYQRLIAKRMRLFIDYLKKQIQLNFGGGLNNEQEIEQAIGD